MELSRQSLPFFEFGQLGPRGFQLGPLERDRQLVRADPHQQPVVIRGEVVASRAGRNHPQGATSVPDRRHRDRDLLAFAERRRSRGVVMLQPRGQLAANLARGDAERTAALRTDGFHHWSAPAQRRDTRVDEVDTHRSKQSFGEALDNQFRRLAHPDRGQG